MSREINIARKVVIPCCSAFLILWLASCQRVNPGLPPKLPAAVEAKTALPRAPAPRREEAALPQAGDVVVSGEFYDAAVEIEAAAKESALKLEGFFRADLLTHRAFGNLLLDENSLRRIEQLVTNANLFRPLCEGIVNDSRAGDFRLIRVYRWKDEHSALFRLVTAEGVNYHEYFLTADDQGTVRVEDLHLLLAGSRYSAIMRGLCLSQRPQIREWSPHFAETVVEQLRTFNRLRQAIRNGDPQAYEENYASLPLVVQQSHPVYLLQLLWLDRQGDWVAHRAAGEEYRGKFPQQFSADLLSLRRLMAKQKHAEACAIVDRIDQLVNGDPYLDVIRGAIARDAGDLELAEQLLLKSTRDPHALPDSYWELIALAVRREQFDAAIPYLDELDRRFQLKRPDLDRTPEYRPLLASPEYRAWLSRAK